MFKRCVLAVFSAVFLFEAAAAVARPSIDLDSWLNERPALKSRMVWVTGEGKRLAFDQWPRPLKDRFESFYRKLEKGDKNLGMRLASVDNIDKASGRAYFASDQAFDLYAAHAAHVLYVEANRLVPWSIVSRPAEELDVLLAGDRYVSRILPSATTQYPPAIKPNRDFGETPENDALGELNGDPRIGFDFLSGKTSASRRTLIGTDPLETLANLTVWLRDNVGHGDLENSIAHAKTQRWLQDRLSILPGTGVAVANHGCHSASKLMVDLARSVNIPLLHVRSQETDATSGHFFNRTHGGLVCGWGGREPRVLFHTDEIYAQSGEPSFPLDERTGALASPEAAARMYFDQRWVRPAVLTKAGFVFKLERVFPNKGFGRNGAGAYENRADYGMMIGCWKSRGGSHLDSLFRLEQDYALCGQTLMMLSCKNVLAGQLASNIKAWQGGLSGRELPKMHSVKDFDERAKAWLKAAGGCQKFQDLMKQWKDNRGKNLWRR